MTGMRRHPSERIRCQRNSSTRSGRTRYPLEQHSHALRIRYGVTTTRAHALHVITEGVVRTIVPLVSGAT